MGLAGVSGCGNPLPGYGYPYVNSRLDARQFGA